MPTTNGVSTIANQVLQPAFAMTVCEAIIEFPTTPTIPWERVGYLYVFQVNGLSPFQTRLMTRVALYRPGQLVLWSNRFGNAGALYTVWVTWNRPGIAWRCITA